MPTSRECVQYVPTKANLEHSKSFCSDPLQLMFVKNTGPSPVPNVELAGGYSTNPALWKTKACHRNFVKFNSNNLETTS